MSEVQIRPLGAQDLEPVARLFAAHLEEQAGWDRLFARTRNPAFDSLAFITSAWESGRHRFLVAQDDSRVIGFVRFSLQPLPPAPALRRKGRRHLTWPRLAQAGARYLLRWAENHPDATLLTRGQTTGYLADLYVAPAFRRQGVGTRLARSALQWFAEQGITEVYLQVTEQNQVGLNFWQKIGFGPYRRVLVFSSR